MAAHQTPVPPAPARRLSLRHRLALALGTLGLALSVLFAWLTTVIAEDYEHLLIAAVLRAEVDAFRERRNRDPTATLPDGTRLRGYLLDGPPAEALLPALRGLPLGIHELENDDEALHVAVFEAGGMRFLFLVDTRDIEVLEHYMQRVLVAIVGLGTVLSAGLGWWLAGVSLAPLRRLARAVDGLPISPQPTAFASGETDDELGRLAVAIDHYQARLVTGEAQQRAFFAEASHALRTPIAVVQGALELLRDEAEPNPTSPALRRMERGIGELAQLLDALLLVARGEPGAAEALDLVALVETAVQGLQDYAGGRGTRLDWQPSTPSVPLEVSRRWASATLACLMRAAIDLAGAGSVRVRLDRDGLQLTAADPAAAELAADQGLALQLARRLAAGLGWSVQCGNAAGHSCFTLRWSRDRFA